MEQRIIAALAAALDILGEDKPTQSILVIEEFGHPLDPADLRTIRKVKKGVVALAYPISLFVKDAGENLVRIVQPPLGKSVILESASSARSKRLAFERRGVAVTTNLHEAATKLGGRITELNIPYGPSNHIQYCKLAGNAEAFRRELQAQSMGFGYLEFTGDVGVASLGGGAGFYILDLLQLFGAKPANFSDFGSAFVHPEDLIPKAVSIILQNKSVRTILIFAPIGGLFEPKVSIQAIDRTIASCPVHVITIVPGVDRFSGENPLLTHVKVYGCIQHAIESNLDLMIPNG